MGFLSLYMRIFGFLVLFLCGSLHLSHAANYLKQDYLLQQRRNADYNYKKYKNSPLINWRSSGTFRCTKTGLTLAVMVGLHVAIVNAADPNNAGVSNQVCYTNNSRWGVAKIDNQESISSFVGSKELIYAELQKKMPRTGKKSKKKRRIRCRDSICPEDCKKNKLDEKDPPEAETTVVNQVFVNKKIRKKKDGPYFLGTGDTDKEQERDFEKVIIEPIVEYSSKKGIDAYLFWLAFDLVEPEQVESSRNHICKIVKEKKVRWEHIFYLDLERIEEIISNPEVFNEGVPVYWRADLARLLATLYSVEVFGADFGFYIDFDMRIISLQSVLTPEVREKIDRFAWVSMYNFLRIGPINGLFVISRDEGIRKYVINDVIALIKRGAVAFDEEELVYLGFMTWWASFFDKDMRSEHLEKWSMAQQAERASSHQIDSARFFEVVDLVKELSLLNPSDEAMMPDMVKAMRKCVHDKQDCQAIVDRWYSFVPMFSHMGNNVQSTNVRRAYVNNSPTRPERYKRAFSNLLVFMAGASGAAMTCILCCENSWDGEIEQLEGFGDAPENCLQSPFKFVPHNRISYCSDKSRIKYFAGIFSPNSSFVVAHHRLSQTGFFANLIFDIALDPLTFSGSRVAIKLKALVEDSDRCNGSEDDVIDFYVLDGCCCRSDLMRVSLKRFIKYVDDNVKKVGNVYGISQLRSGSSGILFDMKTGECYRYDGRRRVGLSENSLKQLSISLIGPIIFGLCEI
jgi:hypothetical protein